MSETEDSEEEWRFSVDEFDDPEDEADADASEDAETTEDEAEPIRREIEPQEVRAENALFVVLGVALTVGVIAYGIGLI
ncbi:DUF7312 domain-containing protein [Natronorarus salvus]|uniref:DUF7312 domain-containing protein n=1 Tax=Natronorarus salvus TaxID=3117733 RepID=UPI002F26CC14